MFNIKIIGIIIALLGLVGLGVGGAFVGVGLVRNNQVVEGIRAEKITLGIDAAEVAKGEVVDTITEAEKAAEILTAHRRNIAATYGELLAGNKFDATNPTQLTYAQALNLQNNMYTAVAAMGLAQSIIANGAFMIATGAGLIFAGFAIRKTGK